MCPLNKTCLNTKCIYHFQFTPHKMGAKAYTIEPDARNIDRYSDNYIMPSSSKWMSMQNVICAFWAHRTIFHPADFEVFVSAIFIHRTWMALTLSFSITFFSFLNFIFFFWNKTAGIMNKQKINFYCSHFHVVQKIIPNASLVHSFDCFVKYLNEIYWPSSQFCKWTLNTILLNWWKRKDKCSKCWLKFHCTFNECNNLFSLRGFFLFEKKFS